jgi:hypothetical protein
VSIPGAETELLAMDRACEYYNTGAAAAVGVEPRMLYHLPEFKVIVLDSDNFFRWLAAAGRDD